MFALSNGYGVLWSNTFCISAECEVVIKCSQKFKWVHISNGLSSSNPNGSVINKKRGQKPAVKLEKKYIRKTWTNVYGWKRSILNGSKGILVGKNWTIEDRESFVGLNRNI